MRSVFVATILLISSLSAVAHPGHGTGDGESVQHYVTSPLHVGPVLAGLLMMLAVGAGVVAVRRRRARAQAAAAVKRDQRHR